MNTCESICADCGHELCGLRSTAAELYKPPFRYECGYIYDAAHRVVADNDGQDTVLRVRGWGRISYLPDAAALQDKVGELIAEALTKHWTDL